MRKNSFLPSIWVTCNAFLSTMVNAWSLNPLKFHFFTSRTNMPFANGLFTGAFLVPHRESLILRRRKWKIYDRVLTTTHYIFSKGHPKIVAPASVYIVHRRKENYSPILPKHKCGSPTIWISDFSIVRTCDIPSNWCMHHRIVIHKPIATVLSLSASKEAIGDLNPKTRAIPIYSQYTDNNQDNKVARGHFHKLRIKHDTNNSLDDP